MPLASNSCTTKIRDKLYHTRFPGHYITRPLRLTTYTATRRKGKEDTEAEVLHRELSGRKERRNLPIVRPVVPTLNILPFHRRTPREHDLSNHRMAVVLSSEESTYFSSSPLRRSQSTPKFVTNSFVRTPSKPQLNTDFNSAIAVTNSAHSSTASSPRTLQADSGLHSYSSTPASSLSLESRCENEEDDEDQIQFPSYDDVGYYDQVEDLEPPASPRTGDSYTVSPSSNSTSTNVSRPESPDQHAEDDTAVRKQPSRHVDYLSHNWREEDIWSSWKLIVSKRKAYGNSARLENASWRTWTKSKNKLKTVSPETLNWLVTKLRVEEMHI